MSYSKSLGFLGLGVLLVLALLSFASAAITISSSTLSRGGSSTAITVTSTENGTVAFTGLSSITTANGKTITFTLPGSITAVANVPQTITINYVVPSDSQFSFGTSYSTTLTATSGTNTTSQILSFENIPSEYLNNNNSFSISLDDTSVEEGFGEDTNWFPLDKISADINVENNGNERIKSIVVSYGLYDTANKKWIFKNKESSFSLNDGDDKTVTVNFQLTQLSKFDVDNTANYRFYTWATGTDEDGDKKTSVTAFNDIEMQFENDFVILNNVQFLNSESASCGDEVRITADVVNIGVDDQQDVYVKITNTKLGINNQKVQIGDIDSTDTSKLDFAFTVPEDIAPGTYQIALGVYNDNDEVYVSSFGDDDSVFTLPMVIAEGTCTNELLVTISAALDSAAKAGQELDVSAVITNIASTTQTFNLDLSDYASWASLISLDKTSVTLNTGASQTVLIRLKANNDASGEQSFNIVLKQGIKTISQPVSVSVEKQPGFNFTGFVTGLGGGNTYLWVIGALNVLLVFVIIIVAIRTVRKK